MISKKIMIKISLLIFSIVSLVWIVKYNIELNNSISVKYEDVYIENLPVEFEGFRILQVSDLHNKTFGKDQEELIALVNSLSYDMVAFTGDMGNEKYTQDFTPFVKLLDGMVNKEYVFYVRGNNGPKSIDEESREITEIGRYLMQKGCKLLENPYPIKRGKSTLYVSRFLSNEEYKDFILDINKDDIQVVVTHYPMNKSFYENNASKSIPNYDLILAGHYHGGQFRIPGIGALFIPDINGNGFAPSEERVSGLTTWGGYNQYVSRGLGASSNIKFLQFRLFNQPEVNIIKLTSSKD